MITADIFFASGTLFQPHPPDSGLGNINANFFFLWNTVPPHPLDICRTKRRRLGPEYFRRSPRDTHRKRGHIFVIQAGYSACSLRPFEINVPPRTQPIQLRPFRLNLILSKQAVDILDPYIAAGLVQLPTSLWSKSLCVPKKSGCFQITVNYKKNYIRSSSLPRVRFPAPMRFPIPPATPWFLLYSTSSRGLLG